MGLELKREVRAGATPQAVVTTEVFLPTKLGGGLSRERYRMGEEEGLGSNPMDYQGIPLRSLSI